MPAEVPTLGAPCLLLLTPPRLPSLLRRPCLLCLLQVMASILDLQSGLLERETEVGAAATSRAGATLVWWTRGMLAWLTKPGGLPFPAASG